VIDQTAEQLAEELAGARATIDHMSKAMSWISGHDRQGLDHLEEAQHEGRARLATMKQAQGWAARARHAEATLARIQALVDAHPAGIDTAHILEALDQTTPAATPATEPCGHPSPATLLTTPPVACIRPTGHRGDHRDDRGILWWGKPPAAEPMPTTPNNPTTKESP
jgi:hypothetical protein